MSAPVITEPGADSVIEIPQGTPTFEVSATCESDTEPTAELWIDLGWPFYRHNVRRVYALSVVDNGDDTYTTKATVISPWTWMVPQLDSAKRWIRFINDDGSTDSGKVQVKTIAAA